MCVFGRTIKNRRYTETKKNGGKIPPLRDMSLLGVETKCGTCIDCLKERAGEWRIRLTEEAKSNQWRGHFITLTYDEYHLQKLQEEVGDSQRNIAKTSIRRWLELWRKKHGSRPRHWIITEMGHKGTERLHLHGIVYGISKEEARALMDMWKYGKEKFLGYSFNPSVVGYVTKYLTKPDEQHRGYIGEIFCSPGLGAEYVRKNRHIHRFQEEKTNAFYKGTKGEKRSLPMYYKRKLWTDEQREELRLIAMQKQYITKNGKTIRNIKNKFGVVNEVLQAWKQRREQLTQLSLGKRKRVRYSARGGRPEQENPPRKPEYWSIMDETFCEKKRI